MVIGPVPGALPQAITLGRVAAESQEFGYSSVRTDFFITVTKKTGLIYEPRFRDASLQSVSQALLLGRDGAATMTRSIRLPDVGYVDNVPGTMESCPTYSCLIPYGVAEIGEPEQTGLPKILRPKSSVPLQQFFQQQAEIPTRPARPISTAQNPFDL